MEVKVNENRKVYCFKKAGTQNENQTTEIRVQVPDQYQDFNKKIVFVTPEGVMWDIIESDTYQITNAITKYESVKFYIWLTKDDKDFRSEEKEIIFNENVDVESQLTEETSGISKILNILENEIIRVDSLEEETKKINKKLEGFEVGGTESLTNIEIEEILKL